MDEKYYNQIALENKVERIEIKRYALAAARSITDPIRRQKKYNSIIRPQFTRTDEIINSPVY